MVYLIDEYFEEYPTREKLSRPLFNNFVDCEKNLHEMSLEEINKEIASWNLKVSTAKGHGSRLKQYLRWLKDEKGIDTNPDIADKVVFSTINNKCAFSTADIHEWWSILLNDGYEAAKNTHRPLSANGWYVAYAAGILSFYGLTIDQIMSLSYDDVTEQGVKGYNLPLTKEDKEVLMRYKNLDEFENRKKLIGTTYIRSVNGTVTTNVIKRAMQNIRTTEKNSWVKFCLSYTYLYKQGVYDRIYQYERTHSPKLSQKNYPEWFGDFVTEYARDTEYREKEDKRTGYVALKQNYLEYRNRRAERENIMQETITQSYGKDVLESCIGKLNKILNTQEISDDVKTEIASVKNQLLILIKK